MLFNIFSSVRVTRWQLQMFTVFKIKKVEFVMTEKQQFFTKPVCLIKINVKHEHIIMKPVRLWRQPVVHYHAAI